MNLTDEMREARDVNAMAEAFHPTAIGVTLSHTDAFLDAIEAALLYGAGRISKSDFLAAIEDLP